eukprot:gene18821-24595_t
MLNIAHSCVAAVFSIWHVRFNIVGVTVTTNPTETSTKPEVVVVKDYLSPVIFTSYEALSDSLPKYLRNEVYNNVKDLTKQIECSSFIKAAALLASSVRITASEELRALLIFNSDPDDWPGSRDNAYIAVLATVLTNYILCTSNEKPTNQSTGQFKYERILYENLIAMAALEEAIGVREPRSQLVIELLRLLDGLRKQLAGNTESNVSSQGWGASNQQIDKEFNSFINDFQQELLKVYTIGSMNKGI